MSASSKVHSTVLKQVRQAAPHEDSRRQKAFAWAVTAVILTGKVSLAGWSPVVITTALAASTLRRFVRLLSNPRLDVARYYEPFIRAALADWAGRAVLLAIDTTSLDERRIIGRVSLVYRGRAIPLAWQAYTSRSHSLPFDAYRPLLERSAAVLPPGCTVTLLGDRGFGAVQLMAWCRGNGWHYALRLKANRVVITADGQRQKVGSLQLQRSAIDQRMDCQLIGGIKHGLGPVHIFSALAPDELAEAWHIASNRRDGCAVLADYRCRMNIEHSFKDDKSGGFDWERSRLAEPLQVERMLLILAVATLYLVSEGTFVVNAGQRPHIDPHTKRGLSYLKIGLRAIHHAVHLGRRLMLHLHLDPRPDPDPVSPYGIPFKLFGRFEFIPSSARSAGS